MILSDIQIKETFGTFGLLDPFVPNKVKAGLSYGLNSYGYDLRLSPKSFKVENINHPANMDSRYVIDPKNYDKDILIETPLESDSNGEYFIIPGKSHALGVSLERFAMPANVTGICIGKSTYARAGLLVDITPVEAGWQGYLTLEFYNKNYADMRIYANEGVVQLLLLQGLPCETPYQDGKYQNQSQDVTFAKVIS